MNKRRLIIAASLIIIGIVGAIPSFIYAIPYSNKLNQQAMSTIEIPHLLTEITEDITDISISTSSRADVEITYHDKPTITIDGVDSSNYKIGTKHTVNGSTLSITDTITPKENSFSWTNFEELIQHSVTYLAASSQDPKIIISVPKAMNWDIKASMGDLHVTTRNVIADKLSFEGRDITFNREQMTRSIETLNIKTYGYFRLQPSNMVGFKNVTVDANQIELYNTDNIPLVQHLTLNAERIRVTLESPVFNSLTVNATNYAELTLPLSTWNPTLNLAANQKMSVQLDDSSIHKQPYDSYKAPFNPTKEAGPMTITVNATNWIRMYDNK